MKLTYKTNEGCLTQALVLMVGVMLSAWLLPGVHVTNGWTVLLTALVITFLDNLVRPILQVIAIPFILVTMGLFLFIINGVVIMMADGLVHGFEVDGLRWAILMSLIITALNYVLEWFRKRSQQQTYQDRTQPMDDNHFDEYEEIK